MKTRVIYLGAICGFSMWLGVSAVTAAPGDGAIRETLPSATGPMSNQKLDVLIRRLDEQAQGRPGLWQFSVESRALLVITDEKADRMRIMTPVTESGAVDEKIMMRLLQANFDTALDARYAVAQGKLWSVFIHPLQSLTESAFIEGVGQVVNLANTYGASYSSGLLIFRGGDSEQLRGRELIERLKKQSQVI